MKNLILFIHILVSSVYSNAQLPSFRTYDHKDGLHISTLNCITQSENGKIWIGTGGGDIVLFDGTTFKDHSIAENSNHHINNIIFKEDGFLFSSEYAGFYSYNNKTRTSTIFDLRSFLFGKAMMILKDKHFIYFIGSTKIISKNGDEKPKEIFSRSKEIKINTQFKSPIGIILFTNQGNFILNKGEISPLNDRVHQQKTLIDEYKFGHYSENKITIYHQSGKKSLTITLNKKGEISNRTFSEFDISSIKNDSIVLFNYNHNKKQPAVITQKGNVLTLSENTWGKIPLNTKQKIESPNHLFSDISGDYWITTKYRGLIKISYNPFTKVVSNQLFEAPDNFFLYKFSDGIRLFCNSKGTTYIETKLNSNEFNSYNFSTYAITYIDSTYFIASSNGMYEYDLKATPKFGVQFYKGQPISHVASIKNKLFIAISGKGISIYDLKRHTLKKPIIQNHLLPLHIYTSQPSYDKRSMFFGTNEGVYNLSIGTNILKKVEGIDKNLGTYSGISTTDAYGTIWFTIETGIIGITKDNKKIILKGEKYFNSTLFYTMMADDYGNIFIGSNRGITRLKVNNKGKVITKSVFDENNNYFGYETNMRSQLNVGKMIYFGTIEGIFQINTELLENLPNPPPPEIAIEYKNVDRTINQSELFVNLSVNNPKINTLSYQYRIDNDKWFSIENNLNKTIIKGLTNGVHTLEARATYDNVKYGEASSQTFKVNIPIWSSTILIALLISGVLILNFIILNYYKKFKSTKLVDSKDILFNFSLTPVILFFAAITTPFSLLIIFITETELEIKLTSTLITTFLLLTLFSASLQLRRTRKTQHYIILLKISLAILVFNYSWQLYQTNGHPFIIIGLILILSIVPYIYIKIKEVILFTFIISITSIIIILKIESPIYPISFFIYALSISSFLNIFYSYLRYDSLEKLIFISSIINKGSMPVIAFDKSNIINYASANISLFINENYSNIINENISILDSHFSLSNSLKIIDLKKDFKDGEKHLIPMTGKDNETRWMEWTFKKFSKDINLILGQDVSERMELENTYESLVQQADDYIFKLDPEGRFIFINDAFLELGFTKDELIGTLYLDLVSPNFKDDIITFYKEQFRLKNLTTYREFPILTQLNKEIWIGQSMSTIFVPGSTTQVNGYVALARNITENRKKKELILEQRNSITSSISYARRIQNNLLPSKKEFEEIFDDSFIFSRPKDIVSGDFYWMETVGDSTVLVLGDCTGHGVPGSFMTLLGFNLLNSTVLENRIIDPGQILNRIDQKLKEYLPKGEGKNTVNDAMELTVCVFNSNTNEMAYACAGSRFLIYEKENFTMYKGDNKHAGDIDKNFLGYSTHFTYFDDDFNLYLFTDGFQDQFGGTKDKKFSFRRLIELFEENTNLPLKEQQRLISEAFDNWIGKSEQTDDVTVLSIHKKVNK